MSPELRATETLSGGLRLASRTDIDREASTPTGVSPMLRVVDAPSEEIAVLARQAGEHVAADAVRYYLCADDHHFARPLWASHGAGGDGRPTVLSMVEGLLHHREEREAALDGELRAVSSWLAGEPGATGTVVAEIFGTPTREQIAFLRACRQRLPDQHEGRLRMVVLRHSTRAKPNSAARAPDRQDDEILLTLLLSGGYAPVGDFDRWSVLRRWSPARVAELTSTRWIGREQVYTYAGIGQWTRARAVLARVAAQTVTEVSAMVSTARWKPPLATATLVSDPATAVAALSRLSFAAAAHTPQLLSTYCRTLLVNGVRSGWTGVPKSTAYSLYLAAFVGQRRQISPPTATRVLGLADRAGVDPGVRSLLAYHLGQVLAKGTTAASRDASVRYFAQSREFVADARSGDPSACVSRVAATYNGEALARYRSGDYRGAVRAELAGLAALTAPDAPATPSLAEQRVLLLTNLAEVYGRGEGTRALALACCQDALRIADGAQSLAALVYVVPGMVRRLLAEGRLAEAEQVTRRMLRRFDDDPAPGRGAERAVVSACCRLASTHLAAGAADTAVDWYAEAAERMRRSAPEALEAIVRNLRAHHTAPTGQSMARLDAALTARRAMQESLAVLTTLVTRA